MTNRLKAVRILLQKRRKSANAATAPKMNQAGWTTWERIEHVSSVLPGFKSRASWLHVWGYGCHVRCLSCHMRCLQASSPAPPTPRGQGAEELVAATLHTSKSQQGFAQISHFMSWRSLQGTCVKHFVTGSSEENHEPHVTGSCTR